MFRTHRILALTVGTVAFLISGSAQGVIRYVAEDGTGPIDCLDRLDPCSLIGLAFHASAPGDEVRIEQGTYGSAFRHFEKHQSIVIRGGYTNDFQQRTRVPGGNTTLRSTQFRFVGPIEVTIDGIDLDAAGSSIRYQAAIDARGLKRLHLVNTVVRDVWKGYREPGAAVFAAQWEGQTTNIVIDHSEILGNSAIAGGGVFVCAAGTGSRIKLAVTDSLIAENEARGDNQAWSSICTNDTHVPYALTGAYGAGGGIHASAVDAGRVDLYVLYSTIVNNVAYRGGGVYARSGAYSCVGCSSQVSTAKVDVRNSIINYNDVTGNEGGEDLLVRGNAILNFGVFLDHKIRATLRNSSVPFPYVKSMTEPVSTYLTATDPVGSYGPHQELVDFANGDYRLAANSTFREAAPCNPRLNRGMPRVKRTDPKWHAPGAVNLDGEPRVANRRGCDIGAY